MSRFFQKTVTFVLYAGLAIMLGLCGSVIALSAKAGTIQENYRLIAAMGAGIVLDCVAIGFWSIINLLNRKIDQQTRTLNDHVKSTNERIHDLHVDFRSHRSESKQAAESIQASIAALARSTKKEASIADEAVTTYACPRCSSELGQHDKRCAACGAQFWGDWRPVKK
ncbi:MAG: hypothetical protein QM674_12780 [Burkholderiaceae bacterium]